MRKAREISDLSNNGGGDGRAHTSERLQRYGEVCPMCLADEIPNLLVKLVLPSFFMFQRIEVGLEGNLLRGMLEPSIAKPHLVAITPGLPVVPKIVAQQEMLDSDAGSSLIYACCVTSTHQVAQGLMQAVRHPNEGELARTQQSR